MREGWKLGKVCCDEGFIKVIITFRVSFKFELRHRINQQRFPEFDESLS